MLDNLTPLGGARLPALLPPEMAGPLLEALEPSRAAMLVSRLARDVREEVIGHVKGAAAGEITAIALVTACAVLLWSRSWGLTLVIGSSMVLSMMAAGLSGAAIPMVLTVLKQDPAQSSSIVLTTITDVVGFFSFLGIATLLASML